MKIKVGAYCRVSTNKDDQVNSLESQKKYFNDYIKSNPDWEFVDIYADESKSGTNTKKRFEFNRMIADAESSRLNIILTKEVCRFARNTVDTLIHTRKLKKLGIGVIFTLDNINTLDNEGELRLSLMATLAQEESRKTSERVKWGQKRRMEQGVVFGRELLGYNLINGVLSINEEEAEIVRLIFHKYTMEGKGTHVIARELYEANIQSKRYVTRWSNTVILRLVKNEKYVGDLAQKKTLTPDFLDHKKIYNKGQEDMVYLKDHHEPIINRELWDATQAELQKRTTSKEQKSKYSNRYWCSGKLICSECGSRFISRTKKLKNGQVYKAWRCYEASTHGTRKIDLNGNEVGCNIGSINHIALGNVVNYILESINSNKEEMISELIQEIKKLTKQQKIKSTDSLNNKINLLNNKKQKIIDSMIEGIISKNDMILMNTKYDAEIINIQVEIKNIEDINLINSKQTDNLQIYIDRIKAIVNQVDNKDMDEVYKQMVNKIIVHPDNILELYLSCMPTPIKIQYSYSGKNGDYDMEYTFINE